MKSKYYKNKLMYFLVVIVTIIVYLVIHLYCDGLRKDIFKENSAYENNLNKQPINNIISTKKEKDKEPVAVKKIKLSSNKISMKIGSKKKITALVEPYNATNKGLIWESSDPSIATVDANGNIVALKEGIVTITVRTKDGSVKATCVININPIKVDEIKLNPTKMSLKVNTSANIVAVTKPDSVSNDELIWESSDPSVAKVDKNGRVTGVGVGEAIITAKTKDGKVTTTCTVNIVTDTVPVSKIKLNHDKVSVKVGSKEQILAKIEPENATERELIWESSDPSVATVDSNGKITGVKVGTATITVKTKDGKVKETCKVIVEPIKVDKIILNTNEMTLEVNDTGQIIAIVEPDNATNPELIYESSNPNVAKVDKNGKVTGVSVGETIITVKTKDGKIKETCKVIIEPIKVDEINLNPTSLSLKVNSSTNIVAVVEPDDATDKDLIWTSSNPSVATVDSNGKVTGVSVGTAIITAKTKDGKVTATCTVNIVSDSVPVSNIILDHENISVEVGSTAQLLATIEPENATERDLIWESSNPSIATVDENGKVTGVSEGEVIITVKTKDGKIKEECRVVVESEVIDDVVFLYDYNENNYIDLTNQFPTSDEIGKNLQGDKHTQDFKLKMNANAVGVKYTITMEKYDESNLDDEWAKQFLVNDGIDVANCYRTNGRVKTFNEYAMYNDNPKERILYEGTVTSSEAARGYKDFTYRMWISEDLVLNNSDYLNQNRTFKTRINVYAFKN